MACVTLKRPLDFDPLDSLHSPNRPSSSKRRRCTPIKKLERDGTFRNPSVGLVPPMMPLAVGAPPPSVFRESPLSANEVANNLRDELRRMKRRRQLAPTSPINSAPGSPDEPMAADVAPPNSSFSSHLHPGSSSSSSSTSSSSSAAAVPSAKALMGTKEKPVFTLKQMTLICERMCKERTDQVRQEYDKILQQKLSEQYDAFVKFIDHQIQQRFNQSQLPSYLS